MNYYTALWAAAACVTLAYPNALLGYQQKIVHPVLGESVFDSLTFTSTIRDRLLGAQIIPQVLDDFEPIYYLDIAYSKYHEQVLLGNDIKVKAVAKRPTFTFHAISGPPSYGDLPDDRSPTFTLILTDPDALSYVHPVKSEMCHWIITNLTTPLKLDAEHEWPASTFDLGDMNDFDYIESDDEEETLGNGLKSKPGEIETYFPPSPPKKTGPHRYVFVLLEGDTSNLRPPKKRPRWGYGKERHGVRDWANENNLTVVGANFFFAQHKKQ